MALAASLAAAGAPAHAVINGEPVDAADGIAAAVVMITQANGFCSGTVIAPRVVLTAAHCVEGHERLAILRFGPNRAPILTPVTGRAVHPDYRAQDWRARRTAVDLAVLVTDQPITGTRPRGLSAAAIPQAGERLRLAGYGPAAERDGRSAGTLRSATLTVTGRPSTFQIRLTGQGQGACTGDSGGPTFGADGSIVAVTSWSTGQGGARCGMLSGTVPVAPHRTWIDTTRARLGGG